MTPKGVLFSRAPPFVKRWGSHVHRCLPDPVFLRGPPIGGNRPFSAL